MTIQDRHNPVPTTTHFAERLPGITPIEIVRKLWSHKWFIIACMVISVSACGLYLKLRHPLYRASATLRIDPSRASSLGLSDPQAGIPADENVVIQTELGVLRSNRVALGAFDSLAPLDRKRLLASLKFTSLAANTVEDSPREQARLISALETRLLVTPVDDSELVNVSFSDPDGIIATRMVKGIVAAYERQSLKSRNESVTQLRGWLTAQIESLKSQVNDSQQRLSDFQEANHILSTDGASNTTIDRLRFLNDRLAQAQADRIVKEGDLRAARSASPSALATLFPSAQLSALQAQRAEVYTRYAQLAAKFDSSYPPLAQAQKELSTLDAEITTSTQASVNRLGQEYKAASFVEGNLQSQYDQQVTAAYALDRNEAELAVLQGQVSSARDLLNALENKLQQAVVDAEVTGADVVEVDDPEIPTEPAGPAPTLFLSGALFIGLFAGCAATFVVEASYDRVRFPEEIYRTTGCSVLAYIPRRFEALEANSGGSIERLFAPTASLAREAISYREVRNRLLSSNLSCGHKLLVVASLTTDEGAPIAALNMAISLAKAGFRTLIVDADVQNPIIDSVSDSRAPSGDADTEIRTLVPGTLTTVEHVTNLWFASAGPDKYGSADALVSMAFSSLLKRWSAEFDYLIVSAPPLMFSSESLFLAKLSDGLLLVTTYNRTRLKSLSKARLMLESVGAFVAGVLVSDVPTKNGSAIYGNELV